MNLGAKEEFEEVSYNPFRRGDIQYVVPMTQSQVEIWLAAEQNQDASKAFNLSICLSFDGRLDENILQESLLYLGIRHEALRATFSAERQAMIIYEDCLLSFELCEIQHSDKSNAIALVQEMESQKGNQHFDLANGPLFKTYLFRTSFEQDFLFFVAHHIIADGWSLDLFLNELNVVYNAKKNGEQIELINVGSIAKYNADKFQSRQGERFKKSEQFWVEQYKNSVPILELPSFKPRPIVRDYNAARVKVKSSKTLLDKLEHVLPEMNATFFSFAYSIYILMLHKVSGQDDIAVGVPFAGQVATGDKNLFGHCVNMLPVRHMIDKNEVVYDWVKQVQNRLLEAKDHGDITFSDLISKVKIPRDSSRIPIISTTFNIDEGSRENTYGDIKVQQQFNPRDYETFELATLIVKRKKKLQLQCQYNTSLYTVEQIEGWLETYFTIMESVLDNNQQKIISLDVVSQRDIEQFNAWNATKLYYDTELCIGDLVAKAADSAPNKTAVIYEGQSYSYKELDRRSNAVANFLIEYGVKPDEFVGLYIERSLEMLVVLLGVLKSGAGYLPLDPEYPSERIRFILDDAKANILISQHKLKDNVPEFNGRLVYQEDLCSKLKKYGFDRPISQLQSKNLAYTIYTSGSTGKPKGVQVTHRNVINFLLGMQQAPGLSKRDTLLAVTTISFDIHVLEMYLPLMCEATIEVASRELAISGEDLCERITSSAVTVMQATPSTWRLMLESGWNTQQIKALVGGEALPKDILPNLLANTTELWNMYGPTETTVWSTCKLITEADSVITVGTPVANTQLYVLDEGMKRVAVGTPGELYIGGDGVTNGYLYRPELNAKSFLGDEFLAQTGGKVYRTGDEVRFRPNGEVEYLNRIDNQVKVRGYRIELGEIESALVKHPLINQCVVITREDEPGDVRLVAYYSGINANTLLEAHELKQLVSSDLPPYMVPQHYVALDDFPLTPNGKIDRKVLPSPDVDDDVGRSDYVIPEGEVEKKIAAIWSDLIGVKQIGLFDNFFDVGGHSLLAMKFVARAKKDFNVKLNFQNIILDSLQNIARLCGSTYEQNAVDLNVQPAHSEIETFFFGKSKENYGIYHPAKGQRKQQSVLICPPISQDYVRSYMLLRMLSDNLSRQGYDVLRFDYYGTGDSAGFDYQASYARWQEDVQVAIKLLQDKSGNSVSIFAARLGATLVSNISDLDVEKVIYWDPIFDGGLHMKKMLSLQKDLLRDLYNFRWGRRASNSKGCMQLSAFNYSSDNYQKLNAVKLSDSAHNNTHLILSSDVPVNDCPTLLKEKIVQLKAKGEWYSFMRQDDVLTSPEIINVVLNFFEGRI